METYDAKLNTERKLKMLVVEDDDADKIQLKRLLAKCSVSIEKVNYVELLEDCLKLLEKEFYHVVLSDLNVPDSHGIETLIKINNKCPQAAIIAVTGHSDLEHGRQAIAQGAQDYLVKGEFDERALAKSIEYAVQRKQTELQFKSQNKFLNNVLESLTHPFYVLDAKDYTIKMANTAAGGKEVYDNQTYCHKSCRSSDEPCDTEDNPCPLYEVTRTKKPAVAEHVHIDEQGNQRNIELYAYPLFDDSGNVVQIIEYELDITRRKQAEKEKEKIESQLRQAQKMEAIGTLAGGIAHDFNNMLGAMIGYTNLAVQDIPENTIAYKNLQEVLTAANRARDLVKQILTFGRENEEQKKILKIAFVVKEAVDIIKASMPSNIEVRENIEADSSLIEANVIHIHQIILNLCNNASHAMGEKGGRLQIDLSDIDIESDSTINNMFVRQGNYVRLRISDTGCGMSEEVLSRIFEPFFTTKEVGKGTGMGLSVVHGIVKKCDGIIGVESLVGKGTTFNMYFPRVFAENRQTDEQLDEDKQIILMVDDEALIVDVVTQTLERLGYKVIGKTSSVEALETFRAKPDRFDLVITDHRMPNLKGTQLAQELMAIRAGIPIILCTGFSEDVSPEKAKELGISEYLMKPVTGKHLGEIIQNILNPSEVTI